MTDDTCRGVGLGLCGTQRGLRHHHMGMPCTGACPREDLLYFCVGYWWWILIGGSVFRFTGRPMENKQGGADPLWAAGPGRQHKGLTAAEGSWLSSADRPCRRRRDEWARLGPASAAAVDPVQLYHADSEHARTWHWATGGSQGPVKLLEHFPPSTAQKWKFPNTIFFLIL